MITTPDYPHLLRCGSAIQTRFRRERQPYRLELCEAAIFGDVPIGCKKLSRLIDGREVIRGDAHYIEDLRDGGQAIAVYRRGETEKAFVPTGLIMIKVVDDATLESVSESFKELGYRVHRACETLPSAGWLRHRSENMAEALLGCERLRILDAVVFVEPEMLLALN